MVDDHADVRQPLRQRVDAAVSVRRDDHLAVAGRHVDAAEVPHHRPLAVTRLGPPQSEPPRHQGIAPVGAHDGAGAQHGGRGGPGGARIAADRHLEHTSTAARQPGHARPLQHGHAALARVVEEGAVEIQPAQRQSADPAAVAAEDRGPAGGDHRHADVAQRPERLDGAERSKALEDAQRRRGHVLAADLVARESGGVAQNDIPAGAPQQRRRGRAGGTAAHHDDVTDRRGRHGPVDRSTRAEFFDPKPMQLQSASRGCPVRARFGT